GTFTQPAAFNIDTQNPTVTALVPNISLIVDASVGTTFTLTVNFSEPMDTGAGATPQLLFSTPVSSTLQFVSGAWNPTGTVYTASYSVADANVNVTTVGVTVQGARDADGNPLASLTPGDVFAIDTLDPTAASLMVSQAVVTDA